MSPRVRILALVSAISAVAVAVVVGATLLQSDDPAAAPAAPRPLEGDPPLVLDLGFRTDREARDLRRGAQLYEQGRKAQARSVFARYESLDADVAAAVARWPAGTVEALEALRSREPHVGIVRLNLGLAYLWRGDRDAAVAEWREVRRVDPDSLAAVRAADLLFPHFARGLPVFIPSFDPGRASRLSLDELGAAARRGGVRERLLYGIALQRAGKPLSARRAFDSAVTAAPGDPEALVAAAVSRFGKPDPSPAFARLGPLARRFPRQATVRFHLGLLLLWMGRVDDAKRQLVQARNVDPAHPIAREANRFLTRLEDVEQDRES